MLSLCWNVSADFNQMKIRGMDIILISLMFLNLLVILSPWEFVPYSNGERSIYQLLLYSHFLGCIVYFLIRVARTFRNRPLKKILFATMITGICLCAFQLLGPILFFGYPAEFSSHKYYESDSGRLVKKIYYRDLFASGHWETKEVIEIPS